LPNPRFPAACPSSPALVVQYKSRFGHLADRRRGGEARPPGLTRGDLTARVVDQNQAWETAGSRKRHGHEPQVGWHSHAHAAMRVIDDLQLDRRKGLIKLCSRRQDAEVVQQPPLRTHQQLPKRRREQPARARDLERAGFSVYGQSATLKIFE
jgi:hypothetical protein